MCVDMRSEINYVTATRWTVSTQLVLQQAGSSLISVIKKKILGQFGH